jgi:GTP cyclohydrolase II
MKSQSSRIILEVERAISDLRRGQPVLVSGWDKKLLLVTPGEYKQDIPFITDANHPAVKLMKIAGLLPGAVIEEPADIDNLLTVSAEAIAQYPEMLAESVQKVSEAYVPLAHFGTAHVIAFRPRFGHEEHLVVIFGDIKTKETPYVRVHSSCVTGDVFGSLRCDCGNQLHKAMEIIKEQGAGIILYLSQEGRGIGIANKLRAYQLQSAGMDTVEANVALGFEADERDFALAAAILKQLSINQVVLITNNPAKIEALDHKGIKVVKREPIITDTNIHNQRYLDTKAEKLNHTF